MFAEDDDNESKEARVFFKPRFQNGRMALVPTDIPARGGGEGAEAKHSDGGRLFTRTRPHSGRARSARPASGSGRVRLKPTSASGVHRHNHRSPPARSASSGMQASLLEATMLQTNKSAKIAAAASRSKRRSDSAAAARASSRRSTAGGADDRDPQRSSKASKKEKKGKGKGKKKKKKHGSHSSKRHSSKDPGHRDPADHAQATWASPPSNNAHQSSSMWLARDEDFLVARTHAAVLCDTASGCRPFDITLEAYARSRNERGEVTKETPVFGLTAAPAQPLRPQLETKLDSKVAEDAAGSVRPLASPSPDENSSSPTAMQLNATQLRAIVGDSPIFAAVLLRLQPAQMASGFAQMGHRLKEELFNYMLSKLRCDAKGSKVFWNLQTQRALFGSAQKDTESDAATKLAGLFKGWKARRSLFDDLYPLMDDLANPDSALNNRVSNLNPLRYHKEDIPELDMEITELQSLHARSKLVVKLGVQSLKTQHQGNGGGGPGPEDLERQMVIARVCTSQRRLELGLQSLLDRKEALQPQSDDPGAAEVLEQAASVNRMRALRTLRQQENEAAIKIQSFVRYSFIPRLRLSKQTALSPRSAAANKLVRALHPFFDAVPCCSFAFKLLLICVLVAAFVAGTVAAIFHSRQAGRA